MRSDGRPSVIRVKVSHEVRPHEARANAAGIKPGHLLQNLANGKVQKHATVGGKAERVFADLDIHRGKVIDDAYASNGVVNHFYPHAGDTVQGWIAIGQNITKQDPMISAGDGTLAKGTFGGGGVVYNSIVESAEHENTVTAANFDKSFSIPANSLRVGDVLHVRANVTVVDNNSTDTLTLLLTVGAVTVAATPAVDVADNDIGFIDAWITVRAIGATGKIVASSLVGLGVSGTVTGKAVALAETTLDTTAANVVAVNADWSVAHADNEASLTNLLVEVLRGNGSTAGTNGGGGDDIIGFAEETLDNTAGDSEELILVRIAS